MSTFLAGLGIGSFIVYRFSGKFEQHMRMFFGIFQMIIAVYSFFILTNLSKIIPKISILGIFIVSSLMLIIPAICLGSIFPFAYTIFKKGKQEKVGLVYGFDLIGAVLGSILVGFFLIPQFGIVFAIIIGSFLNLFSAIVILPRKFKIIPVIIATVFLIIIKTGLINLFPLISATKLPKNVSLSDFQFLQNSAFGTVAVTNNTLYISGKEQCSTNYSQTASERKIADYALEPIDNESSSLHILNIGLGCGLTALKILDNPKTQLDVVEINPVVVAANKSFTHTFKRNSFNLIIDDGYHFMNKSNNKYDAIVMDIEDPNVLHSSPLYTVESFNLTKQRLVDDGIFALWTYEAPDRKKSKNSERYLDILYYTLRENFSHVYWYPRVFLATDRIVSSGKEYIPQSAKTINTMNHNVISDVFHGFEGI